MSTSLKPVKEKHRNWGGSSDMLHFREMAGKYSDLEFSQPVPTRPSRRGMCMRQGKALGSEKSKV